MRIRLIKLICLLSNIAMFAIAWNVFRNANSILIARRYEYFVIVVYGLLLFFFCRTYNAFSVDYSTKTDLVFSITLSNIISLCIVYLAIMIAWNKYYPPIEFLILLIIQIVFAIIWAVIATRLFFYWNPALKVLIVYKNNKDIKRLEDIKRFDKRFAIKGFLENPKCIQEVENVINDYDALFVVGVDATLRNGISKLCIEYKKQGFFLPHIGDILINGSKYVQSFSIPVMNLESANAQPEYLIIKRAIDIVVSILLLLVLSPVFIIVSIAIMTDGGPIFYKQIRLTKGGKRFRIIKFRSMTVDAEKDGIARLSSTGDKRITRVGKIIRPCRIDEIPQLLNVIVGDMSLVGPRPERPEIAEEYIKEMNSFNLRLQVKAGLTGYAQVYGRYNTDPYDKLEMDLMYINKMSIITDIQLLFATIRILFVKESTAGIDDGNVTAL